MARAAGAQETRWLSAEELAAWKGLQLMQGQLAGKLGRELAATSSLSVADYAVLAALSDRPDGRMRAYELGAELGWEKSRLSHHVSRMVERSLVERQRCPSDSRGLFVAITQHGRRTVADAAPAHVAAVREAFIDRLTPKQLSALRDVTDIVLAGLHEECAGQDPCEG